MMITTIEIKSMGITRISIEPWQLIFEGDDRDQVCGVELNNEIILAAALEAKEKYKNLPDNSEG